MPRHRRGGPVDPRVEVIGIPDASFGEEYGGLGRPEPEQGRGGGDGSEAQPAGTGRAQHCDLLYRDRYIASVGTRA